MRVEIEFPLEFVVPGTPVSLQAKRPETRQAWQARVKAASDRVLPEGHYASGARLAVTLFYFPHGVMQGDIDNIVKPILDALIEIAYNADKQVYRVVSERVRNERSALGVKPGSLLLKAIDLCKEFIHVQVRWGD